MKILQFLFIVLAAFTGCAKTQGTTTNNYIHPKNPDTIVIVKATVTDSISYLALGDSYTIGQSVQLAQSFPYQLTTALTSANFKAADPTIIATTGWTTNDLMGAIAGSNVLQKKYSFVTLLIGVNDQYQGLSQTDYRANFVSLLHTAISFANGDNTRVFVLSIPDYGVTPYAGGQDAVIGPEIDQFNAINLDESTKAGVNYLNITAISRMAATQPALIAPDGLHPSAAMYKLWIDKLEPMVGTRMNKN